MKHRYTLAPEVALDLVQLWRYIKTEASTEIADRVEAVIRPKMRFLLTTQSEAIGGKI
jgi:hypothetical protein